MKRAAVIVAAGKGRRMQSDLPKQYLLLKGIPVLARSCRIFSDYGVDLLVVVIPPEDETYVREEILRPYGIDGAVLVPGGKERQDSVYQGLLAAEGCDLVMIGRGALGNPWIFRDLARDWEGLPPLPAPTLQDKVSAMQRTLAELRELKGDYTAVREMRKICGWYLKGVHGGAAFRREVNQITDAEELEGRIASLA